MSLNPTEVILLEKLKTTGLFVGHVSWQSLLQAYGGLLGDSGLSCLYLKEDMEERQPKIEMQMTELIEASIF